MIYFKWERRIKNCACVVISGLIKHTHTHTQGLEQNPEVAKRKWESEIIGG